MIGVKKRRIAVATAALLLCVPSLSPAQDDTDQEPSRLEIKHVGRGDRVTVEKKPAAKPQARLLAFPEDEEQADAVVPSEASAVPSESSKETKFQPRFKAPPARQVQHTDVAEDEHAEKSSAAPPAAQTPQGSAGRAAIDEAFAKSKMAQVDTDYTDVIDLCRKGIAAGVKRNYEDYARKLMGWAYNRRGENRAADHKEKEALADFEAAVELNPSSWRAIHNRAVSYAYLGRGKEAMADFDRTIKLNKNYANAYFNRGELKFADGDVEGALVDYNSAIEQGPADPVMLNSRGHALCQLQRYGEALRDFAQALEINPQDVNSLVHRGDTYADMGKYSEAANDYRQAVKVDPKLGRAYQSAAWLMATCPDEHYRNERLAVEVAQKAIDLDGEDDFRYLETLAAAQANAGMFKEAKDTQERAIAKAPRTELVPAEKRMAIYQRQLAYRDPARQSFAPVGGETEDYNVRQASATSKTPSRPPRPNPRGRNQPPDRY